MARHPTVALTLLLVSAVAHAADLEGRVRLSTGAGIDTNARRDYSQVGAVTDGMLSLTGAAEGQVLFERVQLRGSYDGGLRRFLLHPSEDVLIQAAEAEASVALGRVFGVGVQGRGRDRRGGERDYSDLAGSVFFDFVPDAALSLRAYVGGHRFVYWPVFDYSFAATEFGGSARYRLDKRHSLVAFGELGMRRYNADARPAPALLSLQATTGAEIDLGQRLDTAFQVGGGWAWRGPFTLSLTYAWVDQASNSFGETSRRHRLTGTAGFRLPWKVYFFAQLTAQFTHFPDGVYLSPEVENLSEDSENHNSASVRFVRPVSKDIDVELRYALYQNRLPENGLDYLRQVGWIGLTWRP
ncbi:MAG: hypothetical protein WBV82_15975 [Myxococcaceae bacterium]